MSYEDRARTWKWSVALRDERIIALELYVEELEEELRERDEVTLRRGDTVSDDYVELTGDDIPYHLRMDAPPLAVCSRCGRQSWSVVQIGKEDRMPQPDGQPCGGLLVPVASDLPEQPRKSTKKCGACGGRGYWNKEQPRKGSVRELCPVCGGTGVA